jgi:hypothetical protein
LNDQNFTSPCLIRQAKHYQLINHIHVFSSIFNLFCTL